MPVSPQLWLNISATHACSGCYAGDRNAYTLRRTGRAGNRFGVHLPGVPLPKMDNQFSAVTALRAGMKMRTLAAGTGYITAVRSQQVQPERGLRRRIPNECLVGCQIVHLALASTSSPIQRHSMPGYGREVRAVGVKHLDYSMLADG